MYKVLVNLLGGLMLRKSVARITDSSDMVDVKQQHNNI